MSYESPELSIVIVSWNTSSLLQACVASVLNSTKAESWEVIVVDNASADDSAAMLSRASPSIFRIENSANVGFARANNQAIAVARGRYVLLLNSDTIVPPDAIARLVTFLQQHPDTGACGPSLLQTTGTVQPFAFGGDPTPSYLLRRGCMHLFYHRPLHDWKTTQVQTVDWVSGACLLVRREAMEQIGGFDENFFMYFEDVDLCLRLRKQGWKIYYNPDVSITHIGGASVSQNHTRTHWYDASLRYFYAKHYSPVARAALELMLPFYRRMA